MVKEERMVYFDKILGIEVYQFKGIMQKFPNHFHEYYVIGFIEAGNRCLTCKSKEYIISSGDILLLNPFDNHSCAPVDDKTMDYRSINVKPDIMKKAVFDIYGREYLPVFQQPVGFRSDLADLLRELHIAVIEDQQDIRKEELFFLFLEQLLEEYTTENPEPVKEQISTDIQEACDYIEEHYDDHISLDDLSRITRLNKYSLLRAFTKHFGITPYRYLETIRINEAKKLLEKGVEPIDAALRTGFADQSHFTNYFKEFIGLTPKQYMNIYNGTDL